jgi:hypothetical protein
MCCHVRCGLATRWTAGARSHGTASTRRELSRCEGSRPSGTNTHAPMRCLAKHRQLTAMTREPTRHPADIAQYAPLDGRAYVPDWHLWWVLRRFVASRGTGWLSLYVPINIRVGFLSKCWPAGVLAGVWLAMRGPARSGEPVPSGKVV